MAAITTCICRTKASIITSINYISTLQFIVLIRGKVYSRLSLIKKGIMSLGNGRPKYFSKLKSCFLEYSCKNWSIFY